MFVFLFFFLKLAIIIFVVVVIVFCFCLSSSSEADVKVYILFIQFSFCFIHECMNVSVSVSFSAVLSVAIFWDRQTDRVSVEQPARQPASQSDKLTGLYIRSTTNHMVVAGVAVSIRHRRHFKLYTNTTEEKEANTVESTQARREKNMITACGMS